LGKPQKRIKRKLRRDNIVAMSTHYIDFTVIPDEETGVSQLMGTLYEKLHLVLVTGRFDSVGVSFPNYRRIAKTLGTVLRLHASEAELNTLMAHDWLKGLRDYAKVTAIASVPADAEHRTVYRKQFKTNVDRLRRRRMRRKGETMEDAIKAIPDEVARSPDLPYVWMRSQSTKQRFCLFIGMGPNQKSPVAGRFSCYGLSNEATDPLVLSQNLDPNFRHLLIFFDSQ